MKSDCSDGTRDNPTHTHHKPVLIIELNEFNDALLEASVQEHDLPNLQKVLSFNKTHYYTDDKYESDFLEPWVQWVSVHTGTPATTHQIKHLGDVPSLKFKQFWETLSENGITTGVWGVMNGARNQAKNALFFLPDPWTFSEQAFPNTLNALLSLPRYLAKNYCNLSKKTMLKKGLELVQFILQSGKFGSISLETLKLFKDIYKYGPKHFVFISYFDVISSLLFTQYVDKYQPQCSILFMNSLAHIEHHHWTKGTHVATPPIVHGLKQIDKILDVLLNKYEKTHHIIMHNALSQMNTNKETPWILYRQKDPTSFLFKMGLQPIKVEQLMTHDGHAFFKTKLECDNAFSVLGNAHINGKKLFLVEINSDSPTKLFYRLDFTDEVAKSATFTLNNIQYPFFTYFKSIVRRTGKHIQKGTVFSNCISFPNNIYNSQFNEVIYEYFKIDSPDYHYSDLQAHGKINLAGSRVIKGI